MACSGSWPLTEHSVSNDNGNTETASPCGWPNNFSCHLLVFTADVADDDELPAFTVDFTGDGKLGYGFTSADNLEEVDIGPGDKPRPTFISKRLDPILREQMIALLKEYRDCFAWDYTEMLGLDRNIVEHRLPLKKGFQPFQQPARQMKAEVLEEVKKEVQKMLDAGFIRPCGMQNGSPAWSLYKRRMADGESAWISWTSTEQRQKMSIRCLLQKY